MRILYVGNYASPGSPLGYCPNAQYIEATLRQLGHEVVGLDESQVTAGKVMDELIRHDYDILLVEEGRLYGDHKGDNKGYTEIKGYFADVMAMARRKRVCVVAWLTNIFWGI